MMPFFGFSQWTQIGVDIDGEANSDQYGDAISLNDDGTVVAIGGAYNDGANGANTGHVRVFENNSGSWIQIGSDIEGEMAGDQSGISISLNADGSIVAIGARYNDDGGVNSGHVKVYENISGVWTQIGANINGTSAGDNSGYSVSLSDSGAIIAIGSPRGGVTSLSGKVKMYQNVSGTWIQIGGDINGETTGDQSGHSVSLNSDGSIVAIGELFNDDNGIDSGQARVFENIAGVWIQIGVDINGEGVDNRLGESISINGDGTIFAVGEPQNDENLSNAGKVKVYENISGIWTLIGGDINGEAAEDFLGWSVSINSAGTVVACGGIGNDGNGVNAGHVRVNKLMAGEWTLIDQDIDGERLNDQSGSSVSLNSAGSIVAIGAKFNSDGAATTGHARVYQNTNVLSVGSEEYIANQFSLYPNPVYKTFKLRSDLLINRVSIYTLTGEKVKEFATALDNYDVSSLASGMYFIEINSDEGVGTKKIIKL